MLCCFRSATQVLSVTPGQMNNNTFEQNMRQRGVVVDLWLSQKVMRLRKGAQVFVCRRTHAAAREKAVLKRLARGPVPQVVHELQDMPFVVCCSYTPGLDMAQCTMTMDPAQLRNTLFRVADALVFCHEHRIVHLDVKPENVIVSSHTGSVKLIDFEFARDIPRNCVSVTLPCRCGTVGYAAPEVLARGEATFSSDVWSFGCLVLASCGYTNHVRYCERLKRRDAMPVQEAFPEYRTLLQRVFEYTPDKRPTMNNILQHFQTHRD